MGYRGGAPPWVYKNQMSSQAASYEQTIRRLQNRVKELEEENAELKKELDELRK